MQTTCPFSCEVRATEHPAGKKEEKKRSTERGVSVSTLLRYTILEKEKEPIKLGTINMTQDKTPSQTHTPC